MGTERASVPGTSPDLLRYRQEILDIAHRHGARNVRVFGSVSRGEAGPESDLDLLVSTTPGTSSWFPAGLILELEELLGTEGRRDHRGGAALVLARAGARGSHSPVRDQRLYLIQMLERVEGIDLEEVWKRIEEDLPPLRLALARLMQRPELNP